MRLLHVIILGTFKFLVDVKISKDIYPIIKIKNTLIKKDRKKDKLCGYK